MFAYRRIVYVGCESTERNENRSEMRALITMFQKCSTFYATTCRISWTFSNVLFVDRDQ